MAATKPEMITTTYKWLRHPDDDNAPVQAVVWLGYWRVAGRAVRIIVRYPGEADERKLKFEQVRKLEG